MYKRLFLLFLIIGLSSCGSLKPRVQKPSAGPKIEHEVLADQNLSVEADNSTKHASKGLEKKADQALEDFINDWYGVPHRMGGMSKNGVDCSGFVIIAYEEIFERDFKGRRAQDLFAEMEAVREKNLKHGDLVFFKVKGRRIDHVGIYLEDQKFAHTSSSRGVMISSLTNPYWQKRFFRGARYKD